MATRHHDISRELEALKNRIAHLERSRQLNRATIDSGVMRVAHGGKFRIENLDGQTILDASEEVVGINNLRVGRVMSPSVPTRGDQLDILHLYVDPTAGDDSASGLKDEDGTINWLQSLQVAADMVPDIWHGLCIIFVLDTEPMAEAVSFKGIQGGGLVYLKPCNSLGADTGKLIGGAATGHISWTGNMHITGINLPAFYVDSVWLVEDGSDPGGGADQLGTITVSAGDYVEIHNSRVNANGQRNNSIYFTNNSTGQITDCVRLNNANNDVIRARRFSFVNTGQCEGTAPFGLRASSGSRIVANNQYPVGTTANTVTDIGGTVTIIGGATATGGTTDTTQTTSKTNTWTAQASRSWGDLYGWRTDNNYAYQGDYGFGVYRGLWFFDHADIRSKVGERSIEKVEIYLSRRASGGQAGAVDHDFYLHSYGSQPSGKPHIVNSFDGHDLGWGQDGWKTVPDSVGQKLRDGDAKGIAIHKTTRGGYSICHGNARIRITHSG